MSTLKHLICCAIFNTTACFSPGCLKEAVKLRAEGQEVALTETDAGPQVALGGAPQTEDAQTDKPLTVVGPKEVARLFGLPDNSVPHPPIPWNKAELRRAANQGRVLILRLCNINGEPVTINLLLRHFGSAGLTRPGLINDLPDTPQSILNRHFSAEQLEFLSYHLCWSGNAHWALVDLDILDASIEPVPDDVLGLHRPYYGEQVEIGLKLHSYSKSPIEDLYDLVIAQAVTGKRFRTKDRPIPWGRTSYDFVMGDRLFDVGVGYNGPAGVHLSIVRQDAAGTNIGMAYKAWPGHPEDDDKE